MLSLHPFSWGWAYWICFAAILAAGVAYRAFWTVILVVPYVNPDTGSYLGAIIPHPLTPFSAIRTAGAPLLFMIGASSVYHPGGILLAHHALWLTSSAALAVSMRKYLGLSVLSLLMLVYLSFNAKAISFEYYAVSEHLSRVLYVFYAAAAFATWRYPRSWWLAFVLAGLVFFNILSKPSAVVLLPATIILYAFHAWRLRRDRPVPVMLVGVVSVALMAGGLLGYAAAYKARYGTFNLTSFEGYNLFSHVGHLVDLDGPAYPDLKRELAPVMKLYREKYVAKGLMEPNWLVFGSFNDALRADFGDKSPAGIISAYAQRTTGRGDLFAVNKIYYDLSVEGIRAHPREYLAHAWKSFKFLFGAGYGFIYYQFLPSPTTVDAHRASTESFHRTLFGLGGATSTPSCEQSRAIARTTTWPLRPFLAEATFGCGGAAYDRPEIRERIARVHAWFADIALPMHYLLVALPAWAAGLAIVLLVIPLHGRRVHKITWFAAFLGICVLGYGTLLALLNIAEVSRFMVNIQDYIVLSMGLVFAGVAATLRRALLRLTYLGSGRRRLA